MHTEEEWEAVHDNVKEALNNNLEFIGVPGVEPCIAIHNIHLVLMRYNMGHRTEKLFLEMKGTE